MTDTEDLDDEEYVDPDEQNQELFRTLCAAAMGYCVNAGIISSIAGRWPEHVQNNWRQKLRTVTAELLRETKEVQDFAEAYDDQEL